MEDECALMEEIGRTKRFTKEKVTQWREQSVT